MNVQSMKELVTQKVGRGGLYLKKYSPEILLGAGLIGMVATIVLASKATLNAKDILDQHNEKMDKIDDAMNPVDATLQYTKEDEMKSKAIVYSQTALQFAKLYGPAIGVGTVSLISILASHGMMTSRQVALISAYNLAVEGFKQYRQRVIDEHGEVADYNYRLGLKDEKYTETEVNEETGEKTKVKKVRKTSYSAGQHSIHSRFFDESNPMWRSDRILNKAFLVAQQNYANDLLRIRGHLMLNEVYERLGFQQTKEGAIVGWFLKDAETMREEGRDGYVDFGLYDVNNDPAREFINETNPTILLDFNVDGIVFDLLAG